MRVLNQTAVIVVLGALAWCSTAALAAPQQGAGALGPDAGISQEELQRLASEAAGQPGSTAAPDPNSLSKGSINFLSLLIDGGVLMIPIALMSLLVVAVSLERVFALRRSRIYPRLLAREIHQAAEDTEPVVPQALFEASRHHPSAAGRILQDVLQKVGRPVPEMETAINEGTQREADHLYGNVRWLTLAAAVTPLIGLLGTVWGMIIAFYNTTQLGAGANKAEFLAKGIYVALVTTLGGLAVAIPAAIFAHYFEGRITKMLASVDKELRRLVPRFESMEGKTRYDISSRGLTRRVGSENSKRRPAHDTTASSPARPPATRT